MHKLDAMKAVYCYFFPEVREIIHEVERKLPDEMWLVRTPAKDVEEKLASVISPALAVPATQEGFVNIDEIHVPIIDRIISAYSKAVPALEDFTNRYPSSGSSEALFHMLAKLRTDGVDTINVFKGEYEGYEAQAKNLGMGVNRADLNKKEWKKMKPGFWFISNPSARDGNIIPNETIAEICNDGHKVILDLAYVGATRPYSFDVSYDNVHSVVMSFSKPYGVFRFRIGGFAFTRQEVPSLYANKWFKDTVRLVQALNIAEKIGPQGLYGKYKNTQSEIVAEINLELGLGLMPSDSMLLAYLPTAEAKKLDEAKLRLLEPFKREDNYRLCLTPYFEAKEKKD